MCEQTKYGFNCVCDHVEKNSGDIEFACEFCGLYTASKPSCNKCVRIGTKKYCSECKEKHEIIAFCTQCGACLYKHSKSLNDTEYPLFECTECSKVNFWD